MDDLNLQNALDEAIGNYLKMSEPMVSDLTWLLDQDSDVQPSRRSFVRASAALAEGYAHCLREACSVAMACAHPPVTRDEESVVTNERGFSCTDRIRLTLRAAYKLFSFRPEPDFSGSGWRNACAMLERRDQLVHPKAAHELRVTDTEWPELRDGAAWLIEQFVGFSRHFQAAANAG